MKDDYSTVFRNIRSARRFDTGEYRKYKEPKWMPFIGGAAMGFLIAVLLFLGI